MALANESLDPIHAPLASSHTYVWYAGAETLLLLAEKHKAVRTMIREMFNGKQCASRWHIMAFLRTGVHELPHEFINDVVKCALLSRNSNERLFAADAIDELAMTELLPNLKMQIRAEKKQEVKTWLQRVYDVLNDGYQIVSTSDPDRFELNLRTPWSSAKTTWIHKDDLKPSRLRKIIEGYRTQRYYHCR